MRVYPCSVLPCRECGESRDPVPDAAISYLCNLCLMKRPACKRCLGNHATAKCDYNVTEAREALQARVTLGQGRNTAPDQIASNFASEVTPPNEESATSNTPPATKTSRYGRPAVSPIQKLAKAALRQKAYRRRLAVVR